MLRPLKFLAFSRAFTDLPPCLLQAPGCSPDVVEVHTPLRTFLSLESSVRPAFIPLSLQLAGSPTKRATRSLWKDAGWIQGSFQEGWKTSECPHFSSSVSLCCSLALQEGCSEIAISQRFLKSTPMCMGGWGRHPPKGARNWFLSS